MLENYNHLLFYMVNSLIFAGIVYYAFSCVFRLDVGKRWVVLVILLYSVISALVFFGLGNPWMNLVVSITTLLVFSLIFSGNLSAKFVFAVLICAISVIADAIVFLGLSYVYYNQHGAEMSLEFLLGMVRTVTNIILLLLLLINILVFRKLINKKARHKHFEVPVRYTISVLLILTGVIFVNILFILAAISETQTNLAQIMIAQFIVLIIMLISIWLYNTILDHLETLEENRLKDQMLKKWEAQYKAVMSSQKTLSKIKHDLRLHFLNIADHLKKSEITEAKKYVAEQVGSFDHIIATDNMPIDTILNYYQQRIKETLNIDLDTEIVIPANMTLDATNVVMILGNALENAMEACGRVPQSERYIRVKAIITAQKELMITITNPYAITPVVDKEGNLITIKPDKTNHGLGLVGIKEILNEEAGHIHIEYENNVFRFMLLLYGTCEESRPNIAN